MKQMVLNIYELNLLYWLIKKFEMRCKVWFRKCKKRKFRKFDFRVRKYQINFFCRFSSNFLQKKKFFSLSYGQK